MSEESTSNRLFYMPRHAQETDIIRQRKADKETHVAWMEEMARQGQAELSCHHPGPTRSPSSCRLIEGRPRTRVEPYPSQPEERASSKDRVASKARADAIAEAEQRAAIARSRPFLRVAAVTIAPSGQHHQSPDHYGLKAHLEKGRRRLSPAESPPRWPKSYGGE